jgi:hypothetical protein
MAPKRPEKKPMQTTEAKMMGIRLYVPRDVHKQFRVLAAQNETDMATLARRVVEEYVARHAPRGGVK